MKPVIPFSPTKTPSYNLSYINLPFRKCRSTQQPCIPLPTRGVYEIKGPKTRIVHSKSEHNQDTDTTTASEKVENSRGSGKNAISRRSLVKVVAGMGKLSIIILMI